MNEGKGDEGGEGGGIVSKELEVEEEVDNFSAGRATLVTFDAAPALDFVPLEIGLFGGAPSAGGPLAAVPFAAFPLATTFLVAAVSAAPAAAAEDLFFFV